MHPPRCLGTIVVTSLALGVACRHTTERPPNVPASAERLMTPQDLQALTSKAPDQRIAYGEDSR
jgi:hypothetical protein